MEAIVAIVSILCVTGFAVYTNKIGMQAERERYREFVRSTKSKTLQEFEEAVQPSSDLPEPEDVYQDLSEINEEILIKKLHEAENGDEYQ